MDIVFRHIARAIIVDEGKILIARMKGHIHFYPAGVLTVAKEHERRCAENCMGIGRMLHDRPIPRRRRNALGGCAWGDAA